MHEPEPAPATDSATIHDIAELAGVHPSTVSRALSAHPSRPVAQETVARIREIADSLGYRANPWAQSLRTRRTMTIGVVIPHLEDNVLAEIFESAADAALALGYQTITVSTRDRMDRTEQAVRALTGRRADGLLLATARLVDPVIDRLRHDGTPYVLINRAHLDDPCIRADDDRGAYLATRHLLERGHRRIALLAGLEDASTGQLRRAGYENAMREFGCKVDDDLVLWSGLGIESGITYGRALLSRDPHPTAIFATNDFLALGVMSAARELGLRVPDDVAIVGYNNTPVGANLPVPLSSVSIPLREMGAQATRTLIESIEGGAAHSRVYEPELIVRESSDGWLPAA